jgi:hypothetical protein
MSTRQSKWPRGLRRGSAAASLLGLRVRIPPGAWMSVCCEYCVYGEVEVSASGWSLVQRSPTECVFLSVIVKPRKRGAPIPRWAAAPQKKRAPHNHVRLLRACAAGSATRLLRLRPVITSKKKRISHLQWYRDYHYSRYGWRQHWDGASVTVWRWGIVTD